MNMATHKAIAITYTISIQRILYFFLILYSPVNPLQHIAAYISSAISFDLRNVTPRMPENDFALSGFFPTDLKLTERKISMHISPRIEMYFRVISNVNIKIAGT